ncbi:MAG: NAD-dependent malic enzyme [Planctomycetes bacterium]|uniref:NAD-dependent malic enzyme n=1 Tax=Candidatus Wunengus sp. YC65 TaxID=3367701 RepID=UPI001D786AD8|nr:NAD-dependent malic enzyme [Planctomycetota bacterium]MBI5794990.1 NAD-dependent malic enzyme [Planctomycetota bacterium]
MKLTENLVTIRLKLKNAPGTLGMALTAIGELGGSMGNIQIIKAEKEFKVRDLAVYVSTDKQVKDIVSAISAIGKEFVEVVSVKDKVFELHEKGKIFLNNRISISTFEDLSRVYTPGVAKVCMAIHERPELAREYTIIKNTVAVITDGTAILGLGDIGPVAGMPVMEGKSMLFKAFGGIDAFPILLNTKDVNEIVNTVINIAPTFGGINLEDISAPRCFEVEKRLKAALKIPVFHDDQHGTAVVCLAGLINALKVVGKKIENVSIVISGAGAAGTSIAKILLSAGAKNIVVCDTAGIIYKGRKTHMNPDKEALSEITNPNNEKGVIADAMKGKDVFIGVSGPNMITKDMVKTMNKDSIVFAMANPTPEIEPDLIEGVARIIATGRSDYHNQINNVLCFPGLFRGALDIGATTINDEMNMAAAYAIANAIDEDHLSEDYIIPSVFNEKVHKDVAKAVADAAIKNGVATRQLF